MWFRGKATPDAAPGVKNADPRCRFRV